MYVHLYTHSAAPSHDWFILKGFSVYLKYVDTAQQKIPVKLYILFELNRLFQKDRGKTASAARILSPNPTGRPLPCLLIESFFYDVNIRNIMGADVGFYCALLTLYMGKVGML